MILALIVSLPLSQAMYSGGENFDAGITIGPSSKVFLIDPWGNGDGLLSLGGLVGMASLGSGSHLVLYNGHHHDIQMNYADLFIPANDGWWQLGWNDYAWRKTTSYVYAAKPQAISCSGVCTTTPVSSSVRINCGDPGCEYAPDAGCFTMTNDYQVCVSDGTQLCVTNIGTQPLIMRDAPPLALEGGFLGGQNAGLCLEFINGLWVERSRRNP